MGLEAAPWDMGLSYFAGYVPVRVSIASYAFHGLHERGVMDVYGYLEAIDEKGMGLAHLCCDWCHAWDGSPEARERNHANAWPI